MEHLPQILLLLAVAITIVVTFQRLHIPTSLGYLLVGVVVGPFTMGPVVSMPELHTLAEFGVVFLLFTIGLNYSIPQLNALRHQILGLGIGQVALTTLVAAIVVWLAGLSIPAAFVFGAVFAQSSTTIISSLLSEQNEENTQHGRLGLAMSVFQDVTAVPFLVIIPVLGVSVAADVLTMTLVWSLLKAVLAFVLVFFAGRWLFGPLFHLVAKRNSLETFTLAILLVSLIAAWTTHSLGLSLAFGGFLAGMMLGETEFRHQVESIVSPFRDVLLGLFFIGIGMRFDPTSIAPIWEWSLLGAMLILVSKILIVAGLVHRVTSDKQVAWRTGLMLSVGGEFGLALIAIAIDASVLDMTLGQIAITSVLLSMVAGALLIRFNGAIVNTFFKDTDNSLASAERSSNSPEARVIIGGYGRVGHTIAVLLHAKGVPFVAVDTDPQRVAQGRADGHQVFYGDITDPGLLAAIHVEKASLLVISADKVEAALATLTYMKRSCPQVPVIARAKDLQSCTRLLNAGAIHAYPETIEASLSLAASALNMLNVPMEEVDQIVQGVRDWGYRPIMEDDSKTNK
ncbi:cation:proton antiporter [Alkalimarinus alittae]|uniref:Cation:proton antiporter n=1 Tax=Alkalimarinus alittae TaxID=2961619 RepID=A0ABY6MXI4_9ALTE|nr:cation:proton antiporter [Alkalimarinus alittae]UZE94542.1 cation:proton antiporter [Alkalimarinus alittae]